MAPKKSAPKRTAVKAKTVKTVPVASSSTSQPSRRVWSLPIAMGMLVIGAGGLWLAVRESSNAPQAAAAAVMTPDAPPEVSHSAPAKHDKNAAATPGPAKAANTSALRATGKPISVTGCVQKTDSGFVLKNAEGTDAPRSRSWKTGFFKKSAVSLDLVDAGNTAHLGEHVGHHVSVTGALVDREMHLQSLRPMAGSCQ
jgi:hypothetical protein